MAKRPTTPYDTLLRVRRIEEDKAKAALATANGAQRAAESTHASRAEYYAAVAPPPDGETDLATFRRHTGHVTAAAGSVVAAEVECEIRAQATAVARDGVRVASMRTQGLERLVERALQAREAEMLAADQRTAEESMAGSTARRTRGER